MALKSENTVDEILETQTCANGYFLGFLAHYGRPTVMKNDDFLETLKYWFSIVIYSIFEQSGGPEIDKSRMQQVRTILKNQIFEKTTIFWASFNCRDN